MKHLKLFEDEDLVKYIVFNNLNNFNDIQYTIFELSNFQVDYGDKLMSDVIKLYYYSKNGIIKKITPPDYLGEFDYFRLKKSILYESTNLQDCLDKLPLIASKSKYNI